MKIKVWLETGLAGISFEDEFEISDDATEKEIEATAKEIAFDRIDWGYEVEDRPTTNNKNDSPRLLSRKG